MSLSRSEQARINGAKSGGPKTEAGKARSAMNANRHNLSGKGLVILDTENDDAFQQLHQAFIDKFQPQDDIERDCLLQAAVARWRLRRVWKLETGIFNTQMLNQEHWLKRDWRRLNDEIRESEAFRSRSDTLTLLSRYERTISREYERAMKAFHDARACGAGSQPAEIENLQNEPKPVVDCNGVSECVQNSAKSIDKEGGAGLYPGLYPAVPVVSVPPGDSPAHPADPCFQTQSTQ